MEETAPSEPVHNASVVSKMSWLDRLLPLNILIVMVVGTLLGHYVPSAAPAINSGSIVGVSVPMLIGLLWMMYPVLCQVKFEKLSTIVREKSATRIIIFSLLVNVILAPLFMLCLAWATLPDLPHERAGIILVAVGRCIAMVLIWNNLAGGDAEWCAILVAVNAVVQLALFGPIAYFLTSVIGGGDNGMVSIWLVVRSVLVFLGVPLVLGAATRGVLRWVAGAKWYDEKFLPFIEPHAVIGLLYTILIMFILQGNSIIHDIPNALRTAVPLILYFPSVFSLTFIASLYILESPFHIAVTQSFTATGNNFELTIAVAVATYGIESKEAFASVVGSLIEVPVLLSLVYLSKWWENWYNTVLSRRKLQFESINLLRTKETEIVLPE
ncbi:hypothetical protein HK100_006004 [Physocladia obscura]|uniref:Arsenite transporter n=1 Tax=Physocladia obscura TaxID=109957 RepID=A0AAD5T670_9FUNG|nr:hypothetical protein HK100_006004 [Physocladia obscura]